MCVEVLLPCSLFGTSINSCFFIRRTNQDQGRTGRCGLRQAYAPTASSSHLPLPRTDIKLESALCARYAASCKSAPLPITTALVPLLTSLTNASHAQVMATPCPTTLISMT